MITIKKLTYLCSVLVCSISYVAIAMDNPSTIPLLALPTIVGQDWQQFEIRYRKILQKNVTRLSNGLPHESEEREMIMDNYQQQMLGNLRNLYHQQPRRNCLPTTMTNTSMIKPLN